LSSPRASKASSLARSPPSTAGRRRRSTVSCSARPCRPSSSASATLARSRSSTACVPPPPPPPPRLQARLVLTSPLTARPCRCAPGRGTSPSSSACSSCASQSRPSSGACAFPPLSPSFCAPTLTLCFSLRPTQALPHVPRDADPVREHGPLPHRPLALLETVAVARRFRLLRRRDRAVLPARATEWCVFRSFPPCEPARAAGTDAMTSRSRRATKSGRGARDDLSCSRSRGAVVYLHCERITVSALRPRPALSQPLRSLSAPAPLLARPPPPPPPPPPRAARSPAPPAARAGAQRSDASCCRGARPTGAPRRGTAAPGRACTSGRHAWRARLCGRRKARESVGEQVEGGLGGGRRTHEADEGGAR